MRQRALVLLCISFLAFPSIAEIGTIDVVPAATLLYPFFEVNLSNPEGVDTLLSVTNASATAIMVNMTLWTDYGIPTASFNLYLTGYDTQSIDLREIFKRASPVTASAGQDFGDLISNKGDLSQDINFASCSGVLPSFQDDFTSPELVAAHRGQASTDYFGAGNCGGYNYGDGILRGFVTANTLNQCLVGQNPTTPGYFTNAATNQNVMMGDIAIIDRPNDRVFADAAVHIEASPTDPDTQLGDYTFYSRFTPSGGADHREALPTAWAVSYTGAKTTFGYWRDPGNDDADLSNRAVKPFPCGSAPAGFPMDQKQVRAYGSTGNVVAANAGPKFPLAAGETPAGGASGLGLTAPLGWTFLNLNLPTNAIRQSWVYANHVPASAPDNQAGYTVSGFSLGNTAATGANPTNP
jgi:hypothetical protein